MSYADDLIKLMDSIPKIDMRPQHYVADKATIEKLREAVPKSESTAILYDRPAFVIHETQFVDGIRWVPREVFETPWFDITPPTADRS